MFLQQTITSHLSCSLDVVEDDKVEVVLKNTGSFKKVQSNHRWHEKMEDKMIQC